MLQKLGFIPGFNKQVTETGAECQWFDGDNVRFRYGAPEKIGGWQQLGQSKLTGACRAVHHWDDNAGIKINLAPGDMLIYSGCDLEHWREEFKGTDCGQVFLHYNKANSKMAKENPLDKRPLLGLPAWFKGSKLTITKK